MLYLMTNRINIIIIILLTIKIIPLKAKHHLANKRFNGNAELYGNFTAIEFLKELEHSKPTYDSILIMQNQNAIISSIFFTHLIKMLNEKNYNNGTAPTSNSQQSFGVLSEMPTTTFVKSLMDSLQVPVLQLNELQSFYLKRQYSEHFLSIVYIDINIEGIQMTLNDHKGLLEKLSGNLLHMTTSKVMFLLNFPLVIKADDDGTVRAAPTIDEDVIQGILVQLFQHCWQQKIINVVALLANYQITRKFYSYNPFPEFKLEIKTIAFYPTEHQEVYPYRLNDLKGYKLSIITGNKIPRVIRYKTSKGKEIKGGFVGHFITAFAKKHKCTLVEPLQLKSEEHFLEEDLRNAVKNGTVELSLGITPHQEPLVGLTYPIRVLNWCIMLPVEPNIPGYKFFTSVFKGESYYVVIAVVIILSTILSAALYVHGFHADFFDIFCHDNCLRGVLSQSFSEIANPPMIIRFIYLKICILGILLTTSYLSYFSTYVTHPPKEAFLNSFDDILQSGLKIAIFDYEYKHIMDLPGYKKLKPVFHVVASYQEFKDLRDTFNTKYGYGVSNFQWDIFREQQKIFTIPLFRHLPNLCIIYNIPMAFPVHENSIFYSVINQLILETAQSGLLFQWIDLGFFELIASKNLKLEDLSGKQNFKAMTIDDLRYVLIFLGGMFFVVTLVFLCELLVFYRKIIIQFFKKNIRMTTRTFYSYTHFPTFQLEVKTIFSNTNDQPEIYPYRLADLKGYKLPIVVGGSEPRIISYKTSKGEQIIGGFVGHYIRLFAKKHNCAMALSLPFQPQEPIPSKDLINTVRNNTAEISFATVYPEQTFRGYTYPIQFLNWCIMLPVEANIPGYKFFSLVLKGETYALVVALLIILSMILSAALYIHGHHVDFFDIFCHDDCLRGILNQSFTEITNPPMIIRFIYVKIGIVGILLTTSYLSYFSTYVTRPPKENRLNSLDDILSSSLQIVVWEYEYKAMIKLPEYKIYAPIFHPVENYEEFLRLRDSLNNKYGYVVPNIKWTILKEQQKIFSTPLFRRPPNLCIIPYIPTCFPVHENSIFYSLVNQLILETAQSGLLFQWIDFAFFELLAAKKLKLKDLSTKAEFQAMTIDDLQYVFIFLCFMFVIVTSVFMLELLVFYRKRILNCFKSKIRRSKRIRD